VGDSSTGSMGGEDMSASNPPVESGERSCVEEPPYVAHIAGPTHIKDDQRQGRAACTSVQTISTSNHRRRLAQVKGRAKLPSNTANASRGNWKLTWTNPTPHGRKHDT